MIQAVFEIPSEELMPDPRLTDINEIESTMDEGLIW
jgi:hypothetical protein